MKRTTVILTLILTLLLVACGGQEQEPTSTPEPPPEATATPVEEVVEPETDVVWAQIQDSGQLVVGLSADYPPLSFIHRDFQLDGYDVALIREIGTRLGLNVRLQDQVFPGLAGALQLGAD